ncbi:CxxH/CxxC protein [Listeria booriae]|uniref:CxxH/CxxC protein n=1 Tax=Listeria booriae TaxID=1552123 RepID=UPI00162345E2|nr:CxxH/CxxC protein [Listeria booriae]MBC1334580.1 CxxH/CxxC protein [Listeria booriae]MBC1513858.1 CxxH/CxxC protein [Listeria booriae]MBC6152914.1 CxxH/CxxC protein [Listeria booriae]MBC6307232.1 CxxH/CxxC protein [Listeria booriae]
MRSVIYSCEEHVEEALDDWVYGEETFPEFEKLADADGVWITCGYCENRAIYMVGNECSDTKYRK